MLLGWRLIHKHTLHYISHCSTSSRLGILRHYVSKSWSVGYLVLVISLGRRTTWISLLPGTSSRRSSRPHLNKHPPRRRIISCVDTDLADPVFVQGDVHRMNSPFHRSKPDRGSSHPSFCRILKEDCSIPMWKFKISRWRWIYLLLMKVKIAIFFSGKTFARKFTTDGRILQHYVCTHLKNNVILLKYKCRINLIICKPY